MVSLPPKIALETHRNLGKGYSDYFQVNNSTGANIMESNSSSTVLFVKFLLQFFRKK